MGEIFNELSRAVIKKEPSYFSDRLVIEECENIHIHYRNIRLELSVDEFYTFADKLAEASKKLQGYKKEEVIPLDKINPYNDTHPVGFENTDKLHRDGIDKVKDLILKEKRILPILVRPVKDGYQR